MSEHLLAGPILRRATENRVCVWVATSSYKDLRLEILSSDLKIGESKIDRLFSECTQLGENLFIYLLEARCPTSSQFPLDEFLTYQIVTVEKDARKNATWDLSALAYPGFEKPSFYIPNKITKLMHGSCRKPHGCEDSKDALYLGDVELEKTSESMDITQRPSTLLLTGDQIYGDDVAVALSVMMREKAKTLIGDTEYLPVSADTATTEVNQIDIESVALQDRSKFLKRHKSGFTSGNADNHLLTLGEYAAMHIYMFGNAQNWSFSESWKSNKNQQNDDANKLYEDEAKALKNFEETLPKIRRLCANVPTYMLFDDHDITDDWNITNSWYDRVRNSPLGHRVVSNALAAYWAFQGYGNDPDRFGMDLKNAISNFALSKKPSHKIDEQFDILTWSHRGWGFSVPTNPPIIAIDTRTQRERTPESFLPVLIDRYGRDWLVAEWSKLKANPRITDADCPVFIATTPVMGYAKVEFLQRLALFAANFLEKYIGSKIKFDITGFIIRRVILAADIEAWATNSQGLFKLLDRITKEMHVDQCIFLSGDVHYAFTARGSYRYKDLSLNCYQLTSSAMRNKPGKMQNITLKIMEKIGGGTTKYTYIGGSNLPFHIPEKIKNNKILNFFIGGVWETEINLVHSQNTDAFIMSACSLGLVEFRGGYPIRHTLKNENEDREFDLARLKFGNPIDHEEPDDPKGLPV